MNNIADNADWKKKHVSDNVLVDVTGGSDDRYVSEICPWCKKYGIIFYKDFEVTCTACHKTWKITDIVPDDQNN